LVEERSILVSPTSTGAGALAVISSSITPFHHHDGSSFSGKESLTTADILVAAIASVLHFVSLAIFKIPPPHHQDQQQAIVNNHQPNNSCIIIIIKCV